MRGCIVTLMFLAMLMAPIVIFGTTTIALLCLFVLFILLMTLSKILQWIADAIERKYGKKEPVSERCHETE